MELLGTCYQNTIIFIPDNYSENVVCKMAAILLNAFTLLQKRQCFLKMTCQCWRAIWVNRRAFQKCLRAHKFSFINKLHYFINKLNYTTLSFNVWVRYFVWNIKGHFWNSAQNMLHIHWKIRFLYNAKKLRPLRFTSSSVFLKRHPPPSGPENGIVHRTVQTTSLYLYRQYSCF